jgi:hypothetical protein
MIETSSERPSHEVKRWLKNQVIQEVPEDIALCEFDCRKPQCRMGEWETCERRLRSPSGNRPQATQRLGRSVERAMEMI